MVKRLVLLLLALAALAPASAEAKHSSCGARHSVTLEANDAVRVYAQRHKSWACAYANGRRFEIGRGSEFYADGSYSLEHLHLVGSKLAYAVSQDGVDYTVSEIWLRDVRRGRTLVKAASPVVREPACATGDHRAVDGLVLAPNGHLAWSTTYSCAPGISSYRQEIVSLKPGGKARLRDSGPEDTLAELGLAELGSRVYWTRGGVAESAEI
jgi:hypothetical protein